MDRRETPLVYLGAIVLWIAAMLWSFVMLWAPSLPMLGANLGLAAVWGAVVFAEARRHRGRRKAWKTMVLCAVALATLLAVTMVVDALVACTSVTRGCAV